MIELLVVVAIIAVLVAILLPALNAAREVSRAAVCSSRLKNIGWASQMYFSANNDRVPTDTFRNPLRVCLHPYLRAFDGDWWQSSVNWACPKAPHTQPIPITVTYGMNAGISWGRTANPWDEAFAAQNPFRLDQVDPARFIWVTETGRKADPDYWNWWYDEEDSGVEPTWNRWRDKGVTWNLWTVVLGPPWGVPDLGYPLVAFRHTKKANVLFLDGHIQALDFGQMLNSRLWLRD